MDDMNWFQFVVAIIAALLGGGGCGAVISAVISGRTASKTLAQTKMQDEGKAAQIFQNIAAESGKIQLSSQEIIREQQALITSQNLAMASANRQIEEGTKKLVVAQQMALSLQEQNKTLQKALEDGVDREEGHIKKIGVLSRELDAQVAKNATLENEKKIVEKTLRAEISGLRTQIEEMRVSFQKRVDELVAENEGTRQSLYQLIDQANSIIKQLNNYRIAEKQDPLPPVSRSALKLNIRL